LPRITVVSPKKMASGETWEAKALKSRWAMLAAKLRSAAKTCFLRAADGVWASRAGDRVATATAAESITRVIDRIRGGVLDLYDADGCGVLLRFFTSPVPI
jgi:hypothetical protein